MATFQCTVVKYQLRVFSRAVQCLAKLGDELFIEASPDGLTLRALTSTQSAYGAFQFVPEFFTVYDLNTRDQSTSRPDEPLLCKIPMKCALIVFRSTPSLDKNVDTCEISINLKENELVIQLNLKQSVTRHYSYKLLHLDEEYSPLVDKNNNDNTIVAPPKLLWDFCINLTRGGTAEMKLTTERNSMKIKNNLDDQPDQNKAVKTEISIPSENFLRYEVLSQEEVSFSVRELKAALMFGHAFDFPLVMYFDKPGKPVVCAFETDPKFTADFIIATLPDPNSAGDSQPFSPINSQQLHQPPPPKRDKPEISHSGRAAGGSGNAASSRLAGAEKTTLNGTGARAASAKFGSETTPAQPVRWLERASTEPGPSSHRTAAELDAVQQGEANATHGSGSSGNDGTIMFGSEAAPEEVIVEEEDDDDTVPGTPPPRNYRNAFFGLSQRTLQASQISFGSMLAPDSDNEQDT